MSLGWRGRCEPASLRLWQRLATPARVVFVMAAYTGVHALTAARTAPNAQMLAMEPVPVNRARLEGNSHAHGCEPGQGRAGLGFRQTLTSTASPQPALAEGDRSGA